MPVKQVRQQPAGVLFRVAVVRRRGDVRSEAFDQRLNRLPLFRQRVRRLSVGGRGAFYRSAARDKLGSDAFQPLAQVEGGGAVVAVVTLHGVLVLLPNETRVALLQRRVDLVERVVGVGQGHVAGEVVEPLKLLDGVAFHAGAQPAAHHTVQVHEQVAAQHPVNLVLARGVATHHPFHRARFVGREVVHVHVGVLLPARHQPIGEPLERPLFLFVVQRPQSCVAQFPVVVRRLVAEEVLEAVRPDEGVALEVEEDVAGRRFRQQGEAHVRLRWQRLIDGLAHFTALHLYARLLAHLLIGCRRAALGFPAQRNGHGGQLGHSRDAIAFQFFSLVAVDAGHEGQVVVVPPALIA